MRLTTVFPKINPLPRAQGHPAFGNGDAEVHSRQRRPHVRRHIILSFTGVLEHRITIRNQTREESLEIATDFRIGILLNQKGRGGVLQVESREPRLQAGLRNQF